MQLSEYSMIELKTAYLAFMGASIKLRFAKDIANAIAEKYELEDKLDETRFWKHLSED
jgi:hypothetical protein